MVIRGNEKEEAPVRHSALNGSKTRWHKWKYFIIGSFTDRRTDERKPRYITDKESTNACKARETADGFLGQSTWKSGFGEQVIDCRIGQVVGW